MMAARETMRGREDSTIGDVGISVHMNHLHMGLPKNLAPVAAKPSALMMVNGAAAPIAPATSGRQSSAPMVSPSH